MKKKRRGEEKKRFVVNAWWDGSLAGPQPACIQSLRVYKTPLLVQKGDR